MILGTAISIKGFPVRLTDERWEHILDRHPHDFSYSDWQMILDVVENPDYVLRGHRSARAAAVPAGNEYLFVMYRELKLKDKSKDGFIITAYYDDYLDKSIIIWRRDDP